MDHRPARPALHLAAEDADLEAVMKGLPFGGRPIYAGTNEIQRNIIASDSWIAQEMRFAFTDEQLCYAHSARVCSNAVPAGGSSGAAWSVTAPRPNVEPSTSVASSIVS